MQIIIEVFFISWGIGYLYKDKQILLRPRLSKIYYFITKYGGLRHANIETQKASSSNLQGQRKCCQNDTQLVFERAENPWCNAYIRVKTSI